MQTLEEQARGRSSLLGCGCLCVVVGFGIVFLGIPTFLTQSIVGALAAIALFVEIVFWASGMRPLWYLRARAQGGPIGYGVAAALELLITVGAIILVMNALPLR